MPVTFRAGARGRGRKVAPDAGRLGQAVLVLRNRVDFPTRFSGPFGARRRVRNSGSGQGGSIHSSSSCSSSRRSVAFLESKLACFHFCSRILSRARLGAGAWAPLRSGPARLGWTSPQVMDRRYPSISYIRGLEICMSKNPRGIDWGISGEMWKPMVFPAGQFKSNKLLDSCWWGGYIDARPHIPHSEGLLATHGRTIHMGH